MLNSITNFLHATALLTYASLVYVGLQKGDALYTPLIFSLFALLFLLKVLGVVVHIPRIETDITIRRVLWTMIALGVLVLNGVTLQALHVPETIVIIGTVGTAVLILVFLRILRTHVRYIPIALTLFFVYLLAAIYTCGLLRIGFILIVVSNIIWMILARVPFLYKNAYHNDIYHLALIVSTFVLYHSVSLGLWQAGACG
jgi:hypothetical protein